MSCLNPSHRAKFETACRHSILLPIGGSHRAGLRWERSYLLIGISSTNTNLIRIYESKKFLISIFVGCYSLFVGIPNTPRFLRLKVKHLQTVFYLRAFFFSLL